MRFVVLCVLVVCAFARKHNGPVSLDDEKVLSEYTNKDLFDAFMALNERSYSSLAEQRHRFNIFTENLVDIRAHNENLNAHRLGLTTFADRTEDEFEALSSKQNANATNVVKSEMKASSRSLKLVPQGSSTAGSDKTIQDAAAAANTLAVVLLAEKYFFDWRRQHYTGGGAAHMSGVSLVKNQGLFCGACYAFAATGAMETYAWITGWAASGSQVAQGPRSNEGPPIYSQQVIIDCGSSSGGNGCGGGSPISGWIYAGAHGVLLEEKYSYQGFQWFCDDATAAVGNKNIANSWYTLQSPHQDIMFKFLKLQPLTSTMAQGGLMLYKSGVFSGKRCSADGLYCPSEADGYGCGIKADHVVLVVGYYSGGTNNWMSALVFGSKKRSLLQTTGYSDIGPSGGVGGMYTGDEPCVPWETINCSPRDLANYFIVKNSYGENYGEKGYTRFAMGGAKGTYTSGVLLQGICGVVGKVMFPYYFSGPEKGHINNEFPVNADGPILSAPPRVGYSPDEMLTASGFELGSLGDYDIIEGGNDLVVQGGIAGALVGVGVVATLNPDGVENAIKKLTDTKNYGNGAPGTLGNFGFLASNVLGSAMYSSFAKDTTEYVTTKTLPMVGEYFNAGVYAAYYGAPKILTKANAKEILKIGHGFQKNYVGNSPGLYQPVTEKQRNTGKDNSAQMGQNLKDLVPAIGHGINIGLLDAIIAVPQYSDYIVAAYDYIHKFQIKEGNNIHMTIGDALYAARIAPDVISYVKTGQAEAQKYINKITKDLNIAPWHFPPKRSVTTTGAATVSVPTTAALNAILARTDFVFTKDTAMASIFTPAANAVAAHKAEVKAAAAAAAAAAANCNSQCTAENVSGRRLLRDNVVRGGVRKPCCDLSLECQYRSDTLNEKVCYSPDNGECSEAMCSFIDYGK